MGNEESNSIFSNLRTAFFRNFTCVFSGFISEISVRNIESDIRLIELVLNGIYDFFESLMGSAESETSNRDSFRRGNF